MFLQSRGTSLTVTPAKAGAHCPAGAAAMTRGTLGLAGQWIPAFAGMTGSFGRVEQATTA